MHCHRSPIPILGWFRSRFDSSQPLAPSGWHRHDLSSATSVSLFHGDVIPVPDVTGNQGVGG